jgi:hypothetical protein
LPWTERREDGIHVGFFVFARRFGFAFWRKIRRPTERKQVLDTGACREAILERE